MTAAKVIRQAVHDEYRKLPVGRYPTEDTLGISRKDWQQDVKGLLRKVPRDLRRTADKNPDVLLAALLRNGKTGTDYRGESFFATSKVVSPEGAVADTFDNLFTSTALTEVNLATVCQAMRSYKGPDGLVLGVRPDTLIIPPSLEHDAAVATMLKSIVFSRGTNIAPGQAANTAAQGDNPMATILKWIKNIVVLPELQDGQSINNTSWYVADCSEGPVGLLYVLGQEAEYATLMDPTSETVFNNDEYRFGWRKVEGVAYGLPQYLSRADA
jgi:phage major head subunit gpT-like protein